MSTMDELFAEVFGDDQEKSASAEIDHADVIEKIAADLTDEDIAEADKIIQDSEEEKVAAEHYQLGRFMARGMWDQLDELQKKAAGADMVGMGSKSYNSPGAPGNATIAAGGDTSPGGGGAEPGPKAPDAEGQSYTTPQDGSNVLAKIRKSIDSIHQPESATKKQDSMGVLKKIVDAAKQQRTKQHASEVQSNLTAG